MNFKSSVDLFSFNYVILIIFLVVFFLVSVYFQRKNKRKFSKSFDKVNLIEKAYLDNKLKMYIVEYENKKFIIVDNGNSITISESLSE